MTASRGRARRRQPRPPPPRAVARGPRRRRPAAAASGSRSAPARTPRPRRRPVARMLAPASVDVAYPGVWLADGVYATHGHYVDRHSTVPSFERLAAGALGRVLNDRLDDISAPDDYEIVLAPLYALLDAIAARAPDGHGPSHANASTRAWRALAGDGRRPLRRTLLAGRVPARRARAQPRRRRPVPRRPVAGRSCAAPACGRWRRSSAACGSTRATSSSATRTGPGRSRRTIRRTGRCPAAAGCTTAGRGSLERAWTRDGTASPYWPGGAVALDGDGSPRHVRLLDDPGLVPPELRLRRRAARARARSTRRGTRRRRRRRGRARPRC